MHSTFDERNWLAWLVRVRIFILTLLLAIELAVAQFSPAPVPLRLFISTILFWYSLSLFYVLLLSFWQEHRLQASLQVLTDLKNAQQERLMAATMKFLRERSKILIAPDYSDYKP